MAISENSVVNLSLELLCSLSSSYRNQKSRMLQMRARRIEKLFLLGFAQK
jgi:hypothetical protein